MKLKHLIIILILFVSGCAVSTPYELAINKEYVGVVKDIKVIDYGVLEGTITFIYTDTLEFMIGSKVDLKKGTKCYTYTTYDGSRTYVIWEYAKRGYRVD